MDFWSIVIRNTSELGVVANLRDIPWTPLHIGLVLILTRFGCIVHELTAISKNKLVVLVVEFLPELVHQVLVLCLLLALPFLLLLELPLVEI